MKTPEQSAAEEIGELVRRNFEHDPETFIDCLDGLSGAFSAIIKKYRSVENERLRTAIRDYLVWKQKNMATCNPHIIEQERKLEDALKGNPK